MAINKRLIRTNDEAATGLSFNTVTYTGIGEVNSITGVGFQPDLIWIKDRSSALNHLLADTVRGISTDSSNTTNLLLSNSTIAELTNRSEIRNLNTDGFDVTGSGSGSNTTGDEFVAWCWKAGGAAVTNTDGTITSQVSANTEAGFSIVSYTGNGANGTVGHGLGVTPNIVLTKRRNSTSNWSFNGNIGGLIYGTNKLALNETAGITADLNEVLAANSNNFTAGTSGAVGASGGTYVAYCFAEVEGFSNFGSYVGNGSTNGPTITTDFEPAFVLTKRADSGSSWYIADNKRSPSNPIDKLLYANTSNAEISGSYFNFNSNGFQLISSSSELNHNGGAYIYMAFANQF